MRLKIGIHPANHVALFDIEVVLVIVVVKDVLGEDAVDLHDSQNAADLDASILLGDAGGHGALAGLNIMHVRRERLRAIGHTGYPDVIAVEVSHHTHVGVVRKCVLRDQVDVFTDACRVDHVGRYKSSRISAAVEDGALAHLRREGGVWQRFFIGTQLFQDGFGPAELVIAELPAEVMPILFGATIDIEQLPVVEIGHQRQSRQHRGRHKADPLHGLVALRQPVDEGQQIDDTVTDPE